MLSCCDACLCSCFRILFTLLFYYMALPRAWHLRGLKMDAYAPYMRLLLRPMARFFISWVMPSTWTAWWVEAGFRPVFFVLVPLVLVPRRSSRFSVEFCNHLCQSTKTHEDMFQGCASLHRVTTGDSIIIRGYELGPAHTCACPRWERF